MKRILPTTILLLWLIAIFAAGCATTMPAQAPVSPGDALLLKGDLEFQNSNFHAAERLFSLAQQNHSAAGNATAALHARDRVSIAHRLTMDFPYNRTQIGAMINATFPDVPADRRASWLPCNVSQCIESDGETWYFSGTVANIRNHNMDLMHNALSRLGQTPFYDQLKPYASAPAGKGTDPYINPVTWEGTETLSIPADSLPKTGTLRLWVPLPIETESQRNVTVISVEPAAYVKSSTGTGADIGIVYLEVPLENVTGDLLNVTAKIRFTQYEQRFTIDPETVGNYNTSDPLYLLYTRPGKNNAVTPEITGKAHEIIGNETNPYRQAQKIYRYVVAHPYTLVPHDRLNAGGIMESTYIHNTGFGDCGTQSTYFTSLCRAVGIPARTIGGYQLVPGYAGTHFWSEYYLPGYGWVPDDVTIAEGAAWSYNASDADQEQYRQYYSENLDPYRYIIQTDVDLPLIPDPGTVIMNTATLQSPKAVCDTCETDPEFGLLDDWTVTLTQV